MKATLATVAGLVVLILVLGMLAPRDLIVERDIVIDRPKAEVFNAVRSLKQHERWNPWLKRDPSATTDYNGPDNVVGATSTWKGGKDVGIGEQEITGIIEGERIDIEVRFKEPMEDTNQSHILTQSISETQTRVHWGMTSRMRFPMNLVCWIIDLKGKLSRDFDEGLALLKADLEKS